MSWTDNGWSEIRRQCPEHDVGTTARRIWNSRYRWPGGAYTRGGLSTAGAGPVSVCAYDLACCSTTRCSWDLVGISVAHNAYRRTARIRCSTSTTSTTRRRRARASACSPRCRPSGWRCRSDGTGTRGGRRLRPAGVRPVGETSAPHPSQACPIPASRAAVLPGARSSDLPCPA